MAGATRPVGGGAYSSPRSEPGGQNTPRAGRVVASYGTYISALGLFAQQVDQGLIFDDTADAAAIVTADGSSVEDYAYPDTGSATVTAGGSGTDTYAVLTYYDGVIDTDSPVSHWKLGDTTAATDRKGTLNLPAVNGPISTATGLITNNASGPGNTFASTQRFGLNSATNRGAPYNTANWTIEAWIKPGTLGAVQHAIRRSGGATQAIYVTAGGTLRFELTGNSSLQVLDLIDATAGTTYHVAATWDGTNVIAYVNGTEQNRRALTTTGSSPDDAPTLGSHSNGATPFTGTVDEAAWYPTALSAARVLAHYQAGTIPPGTSYTDTGSGTLTATGTATEAAAHTDTATGTATATGTGTDSWSTSSSYTDSQSGAITSSGSSTETAAANDATTGTATTTGSSTEAHADTATAAGTTTTTGTGTDAAAYTDTQPGTLTATGTGTETYSAPATYTDTATGTTTASGTGTDKRVYNDDATHYDNVLDVDNPVSHWKLGAATTATDRKGLQNLPAVNGPIATTSGLITNNATDQANLFTGVVNARFDAGVGTGLGLPYEGAYTMEAWVTPTADGDGVLLKRTTDAYLFLASTGTGTLIQAGLRVHNSAGSAFIVSSSQVPINQPYHIVGTYDGATAILYINGVEAARTTSVGTGGIRSSTTTPPWITDTLGGRWPRAIVDEAAWYPTVLTPARVLAHYQAGTTPTGGASPGAGTLTASGTGTELYVPPATSHTDTGTGTVTTNGTGTESAAHADTGTATTTTSGTGLETHTSTDTATGPVTASGAGTETQAGNDTASGQVTTTGTGVENYQAATTHTDTAAGSITSTGTGLESYSYTDSSAGLLTLTATSTEALDYTDTTSGETTSSGTSLDHATYSDSTLGLALLTGAGISSSTPRQLAISTITLNQPRYNIAINNGTMATTITTTHPAPTIRITPTTPITTSLEDAAPIAVAVDRVT